MSCRAQTQTQAERPWPALNAASGGSGKRCTESKLHGQCSARPPVDTVEATGWVLVLAVGGAVCTRLMGEVRGGLGDVGEVGFPPPNPQSSETRGWGRGVAQQRDRARRPEGKDQG